MPSAETRVRANRTELPRISIEERLLLACARPSLDNDWQRVICDLVQQGPDWHTILAGADANFLTILVLRHLRHSCLKQVPHPAVQALEARQLRITLRALEIIRIQRLIVEDILTPLGCGYAVVKGASLSKQYYGDPILRQYRDIDLLLESNKISRVGAELLSRGYEIINKSWSAFREKDLQSYCQFVAALELRSPSGVIVELHRRLDNSGCVFNSANLMASTIDLKMESTSVRALPAELLFVYLCFHHSRHRWEHLHWCADLAAFHAYEGLDYNRIRELASDHGLLQTVEESWNLHRNLISLARTGSLPTQEQQSLFLADKLRSLQASMRQSQIIGTSVPEKREPDFVYPWQKTPAYRARFLLSRVYPSENDYNALPLPVRLHWVYFLSKPFRVLKEKVTRPKNTVVGDLDG